MSGKKLTDRRRNSINVCYLIDVAPKRFTGGGQIHLANLTGEFKRSNLAVARLDLKYSVFGGPSVNTFIRFLWCFWVISQVVLYHFFRRRFDLIHAHSVPAMAAGKIISMILAIPIVATIHGNSISDQETPGRTARSLLLKSTERWILTKVKYDVQITVARNFLEVPNVNKNIVYIPNGVDLEVFKGPALPRQGRALSHKTVLFVGRKEDPVKGFKVLEDAMKLVIREISDVKLLVAGGSVPRNEVIKMYQRADLFVLPSLSEGFPLTLLEAWAAKLPVVATSVGEVPYLVKEGINGYLAKPGDVKSLAKVIITALKNNHLAKLGENGYNFAKEYTWEITARETLGVYQKIC